MDARKQLEKLLKERGAISFASIVAKQASKGRTVDFNQLRPHEAQKQLDIFKALTSDVLITDIFLIGERAGIIPTNEQNPANDALLMKYCREHFKWATHLLPERGVKDLTWALLLSLSDGLGIAFISRSSALN